MEGWYWVRATGDFDSQDYFDPFITEVGFDAAYEPHADLDRPNANLLDDQYYGYEWSGPIPEPEDGVAGGGAEGATPEPVERPPDP